MDAHRCGSSSRPAFAFVAILNTVLGGCTAAHSFSAKPDIMPKQRAGFILPPLHSGRRRSRVPDPIKYGLQSTNDAEVDLQSDDSEFGRGVMHLSASLNEGDAVAYQTGTWTVDGVEVGDGGPPTIVFAKVDTVQVVWTHNCEHGVIRGLALDLIDGNEDCLGDGGNIVGQRQRLVVTPSFEFIEFGPEQLVARLPVEWFGPEEEEGFIMATLPPDLVF